MANVHIDAFNAFLVDVPLDDGESPNLAALPRVVEFPNQGASIRDTLEGGVVGKLITIQTTCIGETREQAGLMLDEVTELVEGKRPDPPGWSCTRIAQLSTTLPIRDDDVEPAVFYAVATWRFLAVPV